MVPLRPRPRRHRRVRAELFDVDHRQDGGAEPKHANFATRVGLALAKQRIWPLALLQDVTGVGLMFTGSVDLTKSLWLGTSIVLYVVALGYSYLVQILTVKKIIEMTPTPPPPPVPGTDPSGPPPARSWPSSAAPSSAACSWPGSSRSSSS